MQCQRSKRPAECTNRPGECTSRPGDSRTFARVCIVRCALCTQKLWERRMRERLSVCRWNLISIVVIYRTLASFYSTVHTRRPVFHTIGPVLKYGVGQYWISKQRTAHMYPPYTTLRYSTCHYWAQILTFHLLPKRESIQKSRVVAETYISRIMTPNTHLKLSSHARHINSMCSTVHWTVLKNYQIWRICRCTSALAFRTRIYKNVKLRVHENEI